MMTNKPPNNKHPRKSNHCLLLKLSKKSARI